MMLKLYNTESRQKEELKPLQGNHVRMYTCGPTVYNFAHIGNFRTYVFEDVLRRTIKFFGMKVTQVMNLTDVDDKTIWGAIDSGVSLDVFTLPFKNAFFEDLQALNIEPAEHYPPATEYFAEMIEMIQKLLEKGVAYRGKDGSIYYAIRKFPRYGCLSHFNLDELKEGASGVTSDEYDKESASDFVLWKHYESERDGNIFWESPFGPGRPGWHLECSAMAMTLLGETIDIHVGGVDNMFPHHENEIAQSEACSGKQFAKIWMHSEHLLVDHRKMSKSLGNFYTLRDILKKGYSAIALRYLLLQTHYKTQLNFTFDGLDGAKEAIHRLNGFIGRMKEVVQEGDSSGAVKAASDKALQAFTEALADDLNTSAALAAIFDLVREVNKGKVTREEASLLLALMKRFDSVLGVLDFSEGYVPAEALELLDKRNAARKAKEWALADKFRNELLQSGYEIEDSPTGSKIKVIK